MTYFQLERLPDGLRTMRRFAVCFVPVIAFTMSRDRLSGYDPVQFHELIRFQSALNAGFTLVISSFAIAAFAIWQAESRNPLADEGGLGWLSIHGWEGEIDKLPQRGLLPISELFGMIVSTLTCGMLAPTAIVFLPMCWSAARSTPCWNVSSQQRPFAFGTVWLLHATATLWVGMRWLAIPVELSAIVLSELLMVSALRRKAEEMLTNDVTIVTKPSIFAAANSSRERLATPNRVALRVFPFSQLGVVVNSEKPSWKISLWIATIIAWVMFAITTRTVEFGMITSASGSELSIQELLGRAGMFAIIVIGLMRMLVQFEPFVWRPRIGMIARIRTLRPIVWSWDRILLPHALNITMFCVATKFGMLATPIAIAVLVFIELLILLRCGVTPEEWQMTSDARLVSTFLPSGHVNKEC